MLFLLNSVWAQSIAMQSKNFALHHNNSRLEAPGADSGVKLSQSFLRKSIFTYTSCVHYVIHLYLFLCVTPPHKKTRLIAILSL